MKMEWYEIGTWIVGLVGGIGGVGSIVTLYTAKSNKKRIDIENFHSLIEEERKERELLRKEYHDYKEEVNEKIASVKKEFNDLKKKNEGYLSAIYQGYRCTLPEKIMDCPVISMFTKGCFCDGSCAEENEKGG